MKKSENKLSKFSEKLKEANNGTLEGGFVIVLPNHLNETIIGGNSEANNCSGGNCVTGCGTNVERGCGGTVNTVAGCGVKQGSSISL